MELGNLWHGNLERFPVPISFGVWKGLRRESNHLPNGQRRLANVLQGIVFLQLAVSCPYTFGPLEFRTGVSEERHG